MKRNRLLIILLLTLLSAFQLNAQNSADITVIYWDSSNPETVLNDVSQFYFNNGNLVVNQQGIETFIAIADIRKLLLSNHDETGITGSGNLSSFYLYPNPATDRLFFASTEEKPINIMVYAMNGQKLLQKVLSPSEGLDVSAFPKGLYIIRIDEKSYKFSKL